MKTPVQKAIRGVHGDAFYGGAELRPRYWLLKEIRDWFEGALGQDELDVAFDEMDGVVAEAGTQVHEGRVFCLMGGAGTGKSAVAGMLMDDFASNQFASLESQSVYFFFKHDDEERNNAYSFVKTIAHQVELMQLCFFLLTILRPFAFQLAVLDPDGFQKRILKTQQETPDCIKQKKAELPSVKVILNELVLKPLHKLNPKITRLLVCIDALDECEPKSRAELIEALNDRQFELHPRVKLFVTTRPDASLELSGGVGKTRELTKVMNDRDLRAFAEAHICSTWTSGREKDRKEAKRIARALAEAADGLFVWLSLALKQIEVDKLTRLKTAQRIIDAGLSLNDLYTKALERIEGIQEGDGLELFHNVVGALLCLKKPVPLGTLDTLTGQNAEELLIGIAALLNELKEEEVVTFVHKSVSPVFNRYQPILGS
ncbi:hypothetical protein BC830DRAFT_669644 [Chytriomyces sp. MP71]|nr:hypothetical protein BC830DRAFT_669644 [Chytriomyces sp. MP71]